MFAKFSRYAVLALVSLSLFCSVASATNGQRYGGIRTDVTFSATFLAALESLGVSVKPINGAKIVSGQAQFKIPLVLIDLSNASSELIHSGGLRLKAGTTIVDLNNFIIDTTNSSDAFLSGLVKVNGAVVARLRLFDLTLPALNLPITATKKVFLRNIEVKLNANAASTLNAVFGVSAFQGGLDIGDAHTVLRRVGK